jgi:preprotein translocase subunit SecY
MRKLLSIFIIPELRQKILITLGFLAIYRIGYYVPLPFVDQDKAFRALTSSQSTAFGQMMGFISMLGGGNLSLFSVFSLGIMPYISASIIIQVLAYVYPPLEELQKEGESGRRKLNDYTRWMTVGICIIQAFLIPVPTLMSGAGGGDGSGLCLPGFNTPIYWLSAVVIMTTGSMFLMWLGEQIDEYGIGNGISLIIMAGIVARLPDAFSQVFFENGRFRWSVLTLGGGAGNEITFEKVIVLISLFVFIVVGVIFVTEGQRRIPTQSAKHVRGRRVWGGTKQFLPLRINAAGVMPVIFASSLLMIPYWVFNLLAKGTGSAWVAYLQDAFGRGQSWFYNVLYIALIFFFCYFWTAMQFNPKKLADDLKDHGSFIPGYRPGKRTAEYLERVMIRITYVGSAFLAIIAVIPSLISSEMGVSYRVAGFYGGTSLLIVVSVALDLIQKINGHLVMRNYPALIED